MKVGFVGLGQMGSGMAARLLATGQELTVFNRSPERMQPLVAQGAQAARSLADFADSDVVFTMLAEDQAVESVVWGEGRLLQCLRPGAVHISSSTISVALSAQLAEAHAAAGQEYISAPVFGRPDAAAAGKLFLAVAGRKELIDRLQILLDAVGQRTFIVAAEPEKANLVKLSGNFLIASVIESLGEAMALVEKGGINRHAYLELLTSSLFNIPLYKNYGALIADRKFTPPGFAAPLGQKDIRLVLAAAEALEVSLPFASILRDRFIRLAARGGEIRDWSAVGGLAAEDAGLLPKS
ncbi:NAD(P)-dependent oxidoreductase [Acidithiobacillus ferridurans]|jgi:3-hydroxyisobutyrate dehydrogenase-like beta-hydroxyacid dehydrogenase|uniref:NAD(P)-dependent oxidoreductase n=1 Tax=Acidithiobacillus ferridurans TaxID=1232575 RepID=A0A8X8GF83_ACIFI|nr:NAD(P)-dependent oxidoreductase [Acidithiobacillus ferridurans]MBU2714769.1 NAD(P)-dependent oxidoreductase [Acidithiobacillus ferridurans]MBU2723468.1 NAD(P)-dependent oxidoreductase [Acidithiobacillus ferridurans]MBU2725257.1 NAD(P)-dependent oxidoreductase [Acidithiobacillus ferridurans]